MSARPEHHAEQLGALGHPVRLAILRLVVQAGPEGERRRAPVARGARLRARAGGGRVRRRRHRARHVRAARALLRVAARAIRAAAWFNVPGLRRDDWPLEDPKGKPVERVREIRDEVRARVVALLRREGWARG